MMPIGDKEWFQLGAWGRHYMEYFGIKGRIGRNLRYLILKGREPIRGVESRVGLTSPPPYWHQGDWGQAQVRGEPIRGKGIRKEEEWRGISGGYRRQWYPIRNGLFTDTSKPPASVFCAHFLDNPGTLSLLGSTCIIVFIDLIEFTPLPTSSFQQPLLRDWENPVTRQGEGGRPNPGP